MFSEIFFDSPFLQLYILGLFIRVIYNSSPIVWMVLFIYWNRNIGFGKTFLPINPKKEKKSTTVMLRHLSSKIQLYYKLGCDLLTIDVFMSNYDHSLNWNRQMTSTCFINWCSQPSIDYSKIKYLYWNIFSETDHQ